MACWSYTNQHFKFHAQNRHHFPRSANTSSIRGVVSSESCAYLCASDNSCSEFSHSLVNKLCTLSRSCMTDTEWVLRIYDVHVDTVFTKAVSCAEKSFPPDRIVIADWIYNKQNWKHNSDLHYYHSTGPATLEYCLQRCNRRRRHCRGVQYSQHEAKQCKFLEFEAVYGAETADDDADGSSNDLYYALNINGSIARGKPSTLSSTYHSYYAEYGNDGDFTNLARSLQEVAPYWFVNLETTCRVFAVIFYQSMIVDDPNIITELATNVSVRTGTDEQLVESGDDDSKQCKYITGIILDGKTVITCDWPAFALYVSFQLFSEKETWLYFHEIEVHGIC